MSREEIIQQEIRTLYTSLRDDTGASRTVLDEFALATLPVNTAVEQLATLDRDQEDFHRELVAQYGNDFDGTELSRDERSRLQYYNAQVLKGCAHLEKARNTSHRAYWQALLGPADGSCQR